MILTLALASLVALVAQEAAVQDGRSLLTIKVAVASSDGKPVPVPRHVLLVSENPPAAAPRRVQTTPDGTASVRLRPGNYTVESENPIAFGGRAYEWMQIVDIPPGRDVRLELTADNADAAAAAPAKEDAPSLEDAPSMLLARWQDSVVAVWSPTRRATGFLIDARGVIVTNQRAVGSATSVEVQLTPAMKVPARVVHGDSVRDVAVLWIDAGAAASIRPVPLACAEPGGSAPKEKQEIVAIAAPLHQAKTAASAMVYAIEGRAIAAHFAIAQGGAGGPVFAAGARLVGITSLADPDDDGSGGDTQVIRIEEVCATVAAAEPKMREAAPPGSTRLPVEPEQPFPRPALEEAARRAAPNLNAYRISSSAFDLTFITPVLLYAAERRALQGNGRGRVDRGIPDPRTIDPLADFSNWSAYVADYPPVLMIRVTPKLVEGFWAKIARGAARAQGVSVPPIARFKPGFARLQAFCGEAEVPPIHPFKLEQHVSETDAVYEGLYVFDPAALGPPCGTIRIVLYSEKEPQKGESQPVDPAVVRQVWEDFAPFRALK